MKGGFLDGLVAGSGPPSMSCSHQETAMKTRLLLIARRLRRPVSGNHLLVSVLVAIWPVAGMAAGETVPCPEQKAGQWYRFAKTDMYNIKTTEQLTKIESVDGDRLFINQDGETLITDRMQNWSKFGERTATPKYYRVIECPFTLGEQRIYKDVDWPMGGWDAHSTFTVTVDPEFVAVKVRAGSFKAVKIVTENRILIGGRADRGAGGALNAKQQRVSYYVPELGTWVKSEVLTSYPWGPQMMREREGLELTEYSLAN
jgi:hypothetical protein